MIISMLRATALAAAVVISAVPTAWAADLPNPDLTPGAFVDGVTADQICRPGYAHSVRNVPAALKRQVYARYGIPGGNHTGYCAVDEGCEVDHLISLELGGSNAVENLWPQPYTGSNWNAHVKDRLENTLHGMVCDSQISLTDAQQCIAGDWIVCYRKIIGEKK